MSVLELEHWSPLAFSEHEPEAYLGDGFKAMPLKGFKP